MSAQLAARLSDFLGGDAGIGWGPITETHGVLPEEASAIARAVPKRQAEFAAGRRAARIAMSELGHPPVALPVGADRAPIWPDGLLGAITHDAGLAYAAVLPSTKTAGLGIDLTEAAALPGKTRSVILPHAEEATLDDLAARAGFSAKETLFKALFPIVNVTFGFTAARVDPDLPAGEIGITLTETLGPFDAGTKWSVGVAVHQNHLLTALRLS